jgi:hypothetical protein
MSAPMHTDTNPLPRYAPKRCLPERAAQTSELLAVRGEIWHLARLAQRRFLSGGADAAPAQVNAVI